MSQQRLAPDPERLRADLEALAGMVDPSQPGWTRRPFTPWYAQARQWLCQQMETAGLTVRIDAASNLIGRLAGADPALPPIVLGSHTDTVAGGGRFDGIIGVLGALEIARVLRESGVQLRHPLEVVDFTAEEPSDFGISTVGSRGMVGNLSAEMLERTDPTGRTLRQALIEAGGRPDDLHAEVRRPGDIAVYLELHIEQGPVLEQSGKPLAAVTGIVGIQRVRVTVSGQPDHAGTTPMTMRRDALTGAGEMVLALEQLCRGTYDVPVVGTVGTLNVHPNAANVVPARVEFLAEIRTIDQDLLSRLAAQFTESVQAVAAARGLQVSCELVTSTAPVRVPPTVLETVLEACTATAPDPLQIPSGAGHDANQMATIGPAGMIFVPSRGGRSHCPEEYTDISQVALGVEALLKSVLLCDERM